MLFFESSGSVKTVRGAPLYDHIETSAPLILGLHPLGMLTVYIYQGEEGRDRKGGRGQRRFYTPGMIEGQISIYCLWQSNGPHLHARDPKIQSNPAKPRTGKTQILSIITARLSKLFVKMPQITVKPEHFVILI